MGERRGERRERRGERIWERGERRKRGGRREERRETGEERKCGIGLPVKAMCVHSSSCQAQMDGRIANAQHRMKFAGLLP